MRNSSVHVWSRAFALGHPSREVLIHSCLQSKAHAWRPPAFDVKVKFCAKVPPGAHAVHFQSEVRRLSCHCTLEATQGQIFSQSPTDASSRRQHLNGS